MTVSSIIPVNNYAGNSSNTQFDFDFLIEDEKELVVQHTDENGINTILKSGVDYSIKEIGNSEGSYIIFPLENSNFKVLGENEKISLILSLDIKQESEFKNSSYFKFDILEWTFDYIVRILQIINRKIERCVQVSEGSNETPDKLLNELNESKRTAVNAAQSAFESAQNANSDRNHVDNKVSEFNSTYQECFQNIVDTGINTRSNVNLSNLTEIGEKHFLNKTQITNCILEIPQNIKVEPNPKVTKGYVLKAGSVVTFPDGSISKVEQDFSFTITKNQICCYNLTGKYAGAYDFKDCYYSETEPQAAINHSFWWDASKNVIKRKQSDGSWDNNIWSLPLGYLDNEEIFHINNCAGFIGSCQFFLPGIKYLVPNGRNSDGSLNNIEYTTNSVLRNIYNYSASSLQGVLLRNNSSILRYGRYYEGQEAPEAISAMCWFDTEQNLMKFCFEEGIWTTINAARIITSIETDVSPFTVKTMEVKDVFHAVDNNDFLKVRNDFIAKFKNVTNALIPNYSAGVSLSGWTTSNKTFTVSSDGIVRVVLSANNAIESFYIDNLLMCGLTNVNNNIGNAVGWMIIGKGSHTFKASSQAGRVSSVTFYPFKGV